MNRPTVLRNSAEPEIVIGIALKIFYNVNDWIDNATFLDRLDHEYDAIGKARESRSGGQAIAKYKPAVYYGLIDVREDGLRCINDYGRRYYEAYKNGDNDGMVDCLISSIATHEFGRNNPAVPESKSRIEPPKVFLVSCLLLNNILSKTEYAYILESLSKDMDYQKILVDVSLARLKGSDLEISDYAKNNYRDDKGLKFLSDAGFFDEGKGAKSIKQQYVVKYSEVLSSLSIVTEEVVSRAIAPTIIYSNPINNTKHMNYLTALRTKPFLLLAGISGTGKSRIVRELARACWQPTDDEYKAHKPRNFEMVQVKPNWHDSSELIGYVSRIGEKPEFIAGDFLKFVAKAWSEPTVPYFLCLDEMNLAPVEQYFAEYLSVIESRKLEDGKIVTDPLLRKEAQEWYHTLVSTLTDDEDLHEQFLSEGITIPQNLFVIGTVNMDETTFSFSRKVLDRAMTIEMNEVDLTGGLEENAASEFGYIGPKDNGEPSVLIPFAVEGKDVYLANKDLCDKVLGYLQAVNAVLDKTPFKIAYRTRNEFLVYAVCRGEEYLNNALDEMTSMKILSRIEGDAEKTERVLNDLDVLLRKTFDGMEKSISLAKIDEMMEKLNRTQYTSFWS